MNDKQQLAAMGEHLAEQQQPDVAWRAVVPEGWQLVPAEVVTPELSWPLEVGVAAFKRAEKVGCELEDCIYDAVQAMLAAAPKPEVAP